MEIIDGIKILEAKEFEWEEVLDDIVLVDYMHYKACPHYSIVSRGVAKEGETNVIDNAILFAKALRNGVRERCGTCEFYEKVTGQCQDDRGTFYMMVLMQQDGCIYHSRKRANNG